MKHAPGPKNQDFFMSSPMLFSDDLIVHRDVDGTVVSRYGDDIWDFRSRSNDRCTPNPIEFFDLSSSCGGDLPRRIKAQQKGLIWLHIDAGRMRAAETIRQANYALLIWCEIALRLEVDLFTLLSTPDLIKTELGSLNLSYLAQTSSLVRTLSRNANRLEVEVPLGRMQEVIRCEMRARPDCRQTPLIPSRIYCAILGSLIEKLEEIECKLGGLLAAFRLFKEACPDHSRGVRTCLVCKSADLGRIREELRSVGLSYEVDSRAGLSAFVNAQLALYQSSLMHTLAAFSGMRVGEISILPLVGCLESFEDLGVVHYEVNGYTSKLHDGIKTKASWITSVEGARAIQCAQQIAAAVLETGAIAPVCGQEALLFPMLTNPFQSKGSNHIQRVQKQLAEEVCPIVTEEDIDELNLLDLSRGWQLDGIECGLRWPLAFHQLRRSLSVYAHRSGIVTLPVLKSQLKHITDEMRAYYGSGFSRAVNLVFDASHFSHEWNAAKTESSFLGYMLTELFSDGALVGLGARAMGEIFASRSRFETLKLFKNGKLAYRETVLGGCASIEQCKTKPLEAIPFDCLRSNCANLIVHRRRLDHVINTQEAVVSALNTNEPGSVEYRLELSNLKTLLSARTKLGAIAS